MSGWTHAPVLARETMRLLIANPDGIYLDGTLGLGGHGKILMSTLGPQGRLIGLDKDAAALAMARQNIGDARLQAFQASYLDAPRIMKQLGINGFDGALFDLGLSSYQLDDAERGFSFLRDGPLDMRFDNSAGPGAADIVNGWPADRLEEILLEYGEERNAPAIALAICTARRAGRIESTTALARVIESVCPRAGRIHPATKTFQALRIAVNDELNTVRALPSMLKGIILPKGRAAVLTFHSTEDRIIKYGFKALAESGGWRLVNKKVIEPAWEEIKANPRARSAKLRVIERAGAEAAI
ncbi:MAG: 16S rRNA (cytosine(1402)-N(4))-methyltransferase RsmH [Elusimicrobiota bacterium]|jgi:16S rRNA (cytosine1402-N4)-methyltransferase|nr:16S rRNA (cytosine(1402)-N(4))-methyltransferase RsmH [Elusimicrobiota bacterium]